MPVSCVRLVWQLKLIGAWPLFRHPPDCLRDDRVLRRSVSVATLAGLPRRVRPRRAGQRNNRA
jgi:hypothetical protein